MCRIDLTLSLMQLFIPINLFSTIVDGTFCQAALQNKINIKEQLPKYLDAEIQLCILLLANHLINTKS